MFRENLDFLVAFSSHIISPDRMHACRIKGVGLYIINSLILTFHYAILNLHPSVQHQTPSVPAILLASINLLLLISNRLNVK